MKVSVVLVTYNRKHQIKETLNAFLNQTHKDLEIILIDNASSDGTKEMMLTDFPTVRYLWLPENFEIRSLNIGFDLAEGELIWRGDDDSYPATEFEVEKAVNIFKNNYKDIDLIACEIKEMDTDGKDGYVYHWYYKEVDKDNIPQLGYETFTFHGPGVVFKKSIYDSIGGFWGFGFEELEFSTRCLLNNYNLKYFPNIHVKHFSSRVEKKSDSKYITNRWIVQHKQIFRYFWKYFPFFTALYSTFVYFINAYIEALSKKITLWGFIQFHFMTFETLIATRRNEYQILTNEQVMKITKDLKITERIFERYSSYIKRKIFKWKN